jgi:chromosome segregation ATPase
MRGVAEELTAMGIRRRRTLRHYDGRRFRGFRCRTIATGGTMSVQTLDLNHNKFYNIWTQAGLELVDWRHHIDGRFDAVDRRFDTVDKRFDEVDKRFEDVDRRFDEVDKRFEEVDRRFEEVDRRFDKVNARFDEVDRRFDEVDTQIDKLGERMDAQFAELRKLITTLK